MSYQLNVAVLNTMLTITSGKKMHTQQQEFQTVAHNSLFSNFMGNTVEFRI